MNVHITGDVALARYVERIATFVGFPRLQEVIELPQLVAGTQIQAIGGGMESHGSIEQALERPNPPIGFRTDKKQPIGLIGGKRQTELAIE